jgi:hypothetical protein
MKDYYSFFNQMVNKKFKNRHTAFLLALIATLFFIAVVAKQIWFR